MRSVKIALISGGILLVLILGIILFEDANTEPIGECSEIEGSLCTQEASCPEGMQATLDYTCFESTWNCCVPS